VPSRQNDLQRAGQDRAETQVKNGISTSRDIGAGIQQSDVLPGTGRLVNCLRGGAKPRLTFGYGQLFLLQPAVDSGDGSSACVPRQYGERLHL
jgi:hypothetical protein